MSSNTFTSSISGFEVDFQFRLPKKKVQKTPVDSRTHYTFVIVKKESVVVAKKHSLALGYEKFPVLSFLFNSLFIGSLALLFLQFIFSIDTGNPIILTWLTLAGGGMSRVVWTAAKEF